MVMNIRVLTPDRVICSTTADEVILPGLTGQVGVLDGHAALITALDTGLLRIKLNEKWTPLSEQYHTDPSSDSAIQAPPLAVQLAKTREKARENWSWRCFVPGSLC